MKEPMLESDDVGLLVIGGLMLAVIASIDAIFYHESLRSLLFFWLLTMLALTACLTIKRRVSRTVDRYVEGVSQRIVAELRESQKELRTELLGELQEARQELLKELQGLKER